MKSKLRFFNLLIILALFLSACNLPSKTDQEEQMSQTAVAQTVEALLSATPASGSAPIPSVTPLPSVPTLTAIPVVVNTTTPVATPTTNCNVAQFITDVTIPDGTVMTPSQAFTKKWRIKNIGSCAWNGFTLVFDSGDAMGGPATKPISALNPGQEVDLEVALTAPATAGNYRGYWRIVTNGSVLVPIVNGSGGKTFYVDIKVQAPATATNTLPPAIVFTVSTVVFEVTGACPNFHVKVSVTANGAGTVQYHFVSQDGSSTAVTDLVFASAGTKLIEFDRYFGVAASSLWTDIYIDNPNHQQFGRATFTCP